MDAPSSKGGSPYITNFDLVPPSPPRSVHDDFAHPASAFHLPDFDHHAQQHPLASPLFNNQPHTPSYNGSYYNSPFSQHSELSFAPDELNFDLLPEMSYEPSDYDQAPGSGGAPQHPASAGGLLMFAGDGDYPPALGLELDPDPIAHSMASPPLGGGGYPAGDPTAHRARTSPFDHDSPSSNGDEPHAGAFDPSHPGSGGAFGHPYSPDAAGGGGGGRHSRASSVASHSPSPGPGGQGQQQQQQPPYPQVQHFSPSPSPQPSPHLGAFHPAHVQQQLQGHSPQPQPSPRLSVAQQFGSMSVHTPNWAPAPLPAANSSPLLGHQHLHQQQQQDHAAQAQKAQSPPRLLLPEDQQSPPPHEHYQHSDVPSINAPDEHDQGGADHDMAGPQFHIVPATPVSGGAGERATFQQTLATLTQGESGFF